MLALEGSVESVKTTSTPDRFCKYTPVMKRRTITIRRQPAALLEEDTIESQ